MKKPLVLLGVLATFGACLLWSTCGWLSKSGGEGTAPSGASTMSGYWSVSCVTGDRRYLLAGGDGAALIDLHSGKVVEQLTGMVKAVGCEERGAVLIGYSGAWRFPGKVAVEPVPQPGGDTVLALTASGGWVSGSRKSSGGKWKGPAAIFVDEGGESRQAELLPDRFGEVAKARQLPTADGFATRFGGLLEDGRLLVAAGWLPSIDGERFENVPWAFFAVDLGTAEAAPLTLPLSSDAALNQSWMQKIAATADAHALVVAAHDGKQITIGQFEQGAAVASRLSSVEAKGSPSAVAISEAGNFVAVGSEFRGKGSPAIAWVVDQAGKVLWRGEFHKTVIGAHFVDESSVVIASADGKVVRVSLPAGTEAWRID